MSNTNATASTNSVNSQITNRAIVTNCNKCGMCKLRLAAESDRAAGRVKKERKFQGYTLDADSINRKKPKVCRQLF